jgi:hypothetical protein
MNKRMTSVSGPVAGMATLAVSLSYANVASGPPVSLLAEPVTLAPSPPLVLRI